jgi:hypothetical protein
VAFAFSVEGFLQQHSRVSPVRHGATDLTCQRRRCKFPVVQFLVKMGLVGTDNFPILLDDEVDAHLNVGRTDHIASRLRIEISECRPDVRERGISHREKRVGCHNQSGMRRKENNRIRSVKTVRVHVMNTSESLRIGVGPTNHQPHHVFVGLVGEQKRVGVKFSDNLRV